VAGYKYYQKRCDLGIDSSFSMLIENYVCVWWGAGVSNALLFTRCRQYHLSIICLLRHSVHDIRLKFKAEGIWSTIHRIHPSDHSSSQIVKIDLFISDSFSFYRLLRFLLLYSKDPSSRWNHWNYCSLCCPYCRMCLFSCCSCRYFFVIQFQ